MCGASGGRLLRPAGEVWGTGGSEVERGGEWVEFGERVEADRCWAVWGGVGRCGAAWSGVGQCGAVWGGVGRRGAVWSGGRLCGGRIVG